MDSASSKKRVRDDSDISDSTQSDVKKLREDFLDNLDDSDICTSPDLDLFMKSFEQEIAGSAPATAAVVELESDSGDSQPDLGYLLGASDDELGIPPSVSDEKRSETELFRVTSESTQLNELWRFDEQSSGYDSFDIGFNDSTCEYKSNNEGEFVALDSLFDHTDGGFGSADFPWQSETLPAL